MAEGPLASLARRLDSEPVASLAVLRSMLTNADAADRYRAAGEPQFSQIAAAIPTADAELRSRLVPVSEPVNAGGVTSRINCVYS